MRIPTLISLGLLLSTSTSALATPYFHNNPFLTARTPTITRSQQPQRDQRPVTITLQRTACFGFCPIYKLTIFGDGKVLYEGERFVKVQGQQTTTISKAAVNKLVAEFNRIHYFSLENQYSGGHTDAPSAIISLSLGKTQKTVNHYLASPNAPESLTTLENMIDEVVNTQQWIGTVEERRQNGNR